MRPVAVAVVATLGAVLVVATAIVLVVAYGGVAEVSAREPEGGLLHWFLATARTSSIERRAADIEVPALDDPELRRDGLGHYAEMCAGCHGTPGREDSLVRRGLNPAPPSFLDASTVDGLDPASAFWAVKNGIRMSGMPAFGDSHSDDDVWAIVAAVRELPSIGAEEYRRAATGQHHDDGDGHDHGMAVHDDDHHGGDEHGEHEHGQ